MLQRFTESNTGSSPFCVRIGREQHVPDSSNHSPCLIKLFSFSNLEGIFGGNQQPDGSICLSPSSSSSLSPPPPPHLTHTTTTTHTTQHSTTHNITRRQGQREREREKGAAQRKKIEEEKRERDAPLLELASPSSGC